MSAAGGAAAGAFVGVMIANNIARLQKGLAAAREAWRPLETRGLTFGTEPETRMALRQGDGTRPTLAGTLDGVACGVRVISDFLHNSHTEVRATLAAATDGRVGIYPSPGGVLGAIRDWLQQDIKIGDPDFDASFLITAKPTEIVLPLLSFTVRERLFALTGEGKLVGLTVEKDQALVLLNGVELDPAAISTALDLVVEVARLSASPGSPSTSP
jgi:hypothetical protein